MAYDAGEVALHAGIRVRVPITRTGRVRDDHGKKRIVDTTVGRVLMCEVVPKGVDFDLT
jgi:DNA-directed RNA polymerase subunit beta'